MTVQAIKSAVRERDGQQCTKCGMTAEQHQQHYGRTLDVHRTTPGSEYSLDEGVCVTLCRSCHGPEPRRKHGERFKQETGIRRMVAVPLPWTSVLRKMAAKRMTTPLYFLIGAVKTEAERLGITDLPPAPWEIDEDE